MLWFKKRSTRSSLIAPWWSSYLGGKLKLFVHRLSLTVLALCVIAIVSWSSETARYIHFERTLRFIVYASAGSRICHTDGTHLEGANTLCIFNLNYKKSKFSYLLIRFEVYLCLYLFLFWRFLMYCSSVRTVVAVRSTACSMNLERGYNWSVSLSYIAFF
jgi:hypothetical protein